MGKHTAKQLIPLSTRTVATILAWAMAIPPVHGGGVPPLPGAFGKTTLPAVVAGTLPSGATIVSGVQDIVTDQANNRLTVTQNESRAIIDWQSFNIAANASVRFVQQKQVYNDTTKKLEWVAQSDWAALNRIHDLNPTQILGSLSADGKVYLINQNGILFGAGSRVDVHAIAASALNIRNDDFLNGALRFRAEAYGDQTAPPGSDVTVANEGTITAGTGGSVFLVAPEIYNSGTITAPVGNINLVGVGAATGAPPENGEVEITEFPDEGVPDVIYSDRATPGLAVNLSSGRISADSGRVGMYGATVRQQGIIRSVAAVKKGSEIFLAARDRVVTGAGSSTATPISDSTEQVLPSSAFDGGTISIGGLYTHADGAEGNTLQTLQRIEHHGAVSAPGGTVALEAVDRVFLDSGSSIDVSGLWLDRSASDNELEVQLNSVELRDDYGQKDGILKGKKIKIDRLTGSAIGNLDNSYVGDEMSAEERSTSGGTIVIGAPDLLISGTQNRYTLNDLIVKNGAKIAFAGGGTRYAAGTMETTWLSSGGKLYSIATAPQWLTYDSVRNISTYVAARTVGSDAGTLSLAARTLVLDGTLDGHVTRGQYQTAVTPHTAQDSEAYDISVARGLEEPAGGTLTIGLNPGSAEDVDVEKLYHDSVVNEIVLKTQTTPLSEEFEADDLLDRDGDLVADEISELSATALSNAGLGTLGLYANTYISTEAGSSLTLLPGGSFAAKARSIEHRGAVTAAGGTVEFLLKDNITTHPQLPGVANPLYREVVSALYFAPGSSVSVAGERVDNSRGSVRTGHTDGGQIIIQDATGEGTLTGNDLVIAEGVLLDVSGGFVISPTWKVSGGDAGMLELCAMNLELAGDLRGLALQGEQGGEIRLHAGSILVGKNGTIVPDATFFLADDRLQETGFTRIDLMAINDITFAAGATLQPSFARLARPMPGGSALGTSTLTLLPDWQVQSPDYLGETGISATAGVKIYTGTLLEGGIPSNDYARVVVESGSLLRTAPEGSIALTGPIVEVGGKVSALGGEITLKANSINGDLTVQDGAEITVAGYLRQTTDTIGGLPAGPTPQAAGSITLKSTRGDVNVAAGATVDVSGTEATQRIVKGSSGTPVRITDAGAAGSLAISYGGQLVLEGEIRGESHLAGLAGGSLEIGNTLDPAGLTLDGDDVRRYQESGFDALTFSSPYLISLPDQLQVDVSRSLTLDTPHLRAVDGGSATLSAPWLRFINTSKLQAAVLPISLESGSNRLTLSGRTVDLEGSLLITGFGDVSLEADRDIRITDRTYGTTTSTFWAGDLGVTGDLTLQARQIYPTTAARFAITGNGKVTTLPGSGDDSGTVYSAGGSLTITAPLGIEHYGTLTAPMGTITLDAGDGRVYLAEGSVISTGSTISKSYGSYDGTFWTIEDRDDTSTPRTVDAVPDRGVTLSGREVVVRDGATVDVSGGGEIYATNFQASLQGSVNPLTKSGRYVIVPDGSVTLPGAAIYLEALPELGLQAGVYSILPIEYAFVPGALVVEKTGIALQSGEKTRSSQGYTTVAGYATVTDTGLQPAQYTGYAVRKATDVLKEGDFSDTKKLTAGDGGAFKLDASESAVMAGSFQGAGLAGYKGGTLSMSGLTVLVQQSLDALPADFDFDVELPSALRGTLQVEAGSVSNKGLSKVQLGDAEATTSLTVESGAVLEATNITLSARDTVTVEDGATVTGSDNGAGSVTIDVATGTFTLADTASVTADDHLHLKALDVALGGTFSGGKRLTLASERIGFVADGYLPTGHGIFLTESRWSGFSGYEALNLVANAELLFQRDVDLNIAGTLTIDTGRLAGQSTVVLGARQLNLRNSGITTDTTGSMAGGSLTMSADAITVTSDSGFDIVSQKNRGDILVDGFGTVTLASGSDLTLQGVGTLRSVGDLSLSAARIRTNYYRDDTTSYRTADFTVQADGAVNITGNSFVPSQATTAEATVAGGSLEISGRSITQGQYESADRTITRSSTIELPGGDLRLTATGDSPADGIFLKEGANILARGAISKTADPDVVDVAPGGRVILYAANGDLRVESGAQVDVSAAKGNDAGSISLTAEAGNVVVGGDLQGKADGGLGGSLAVESANLDGFGGLDGVATKLRSGGFDNRIAIRSRSGDLSLAAVKDKDNREIAAISAQELVIAADNGSLTIAGAIAADGTDAGGRVELYAGNALTIGSTARISARGTAAGASGGTVILSSLDGSDNATAFNGVYALNVRDGARIDVTGTADADGLVQGGSVVFRAYQGKRSASDTVLNDVNMASLADGTIVGAARVSVEAARRYAVSGNIGTATVYTDDAALFMAKAAATDVALATRLFGSAATNPDYRLQAGIELASAGDLTLNSAWDLSTIRPGGEAGVLTLRAAGNLAVSANLTDAPTASGSLTSGTMQESWGMNLVAGAAQGAARLLETDTGTGNLVIGPTDGAGHLKVDANVNALGGAQVYTESGALAFASGNDTEIGYGMSGLMINSEIRYNLGSYGGTVRGETGNDLIIRAGAIQTATGDIELRIGGDLSLQRAKDAAGSYSIGSIRTTGEYTPGEVENIPGSGVKRQAEIGDYWTYGNGGDIAIETGGAVDGYVNRASTALENAWDNTVGGSGSGSRASDRYLAASYAGSDATEGIATMAGGDLSIRSGGAVTSQMGTFGSGDLVVYANGDLNGRFRVMDGTAVLHSMGSFGSDSDDGRQVLEIADAQVTVTSQGDIHLGAVLNPDNTRTDVFKNNVGWNLTYAAGDPDAGLLPTSAAFRSLAGSVTLYGSSDFSGYDNSSLAQREQLLPPSFTLLAAGDIRVLNSFALAPAERGNLVLKAKGDIDGTYLLAGNISKGHFAMFDIDPATVYGRFSVTDDSKVALLFGGDTSNLLLVHTGDPDPVEIAAGGDLRNLQLEISKMADISAGNDIEDLSFTGQNLSATDVTSISAGNDITFDSSPPASTQPGLELPVPGFKVAGPGTLLVQAKHAIDLGTSEGIQSVGNLLNSSLGTTGSTVMVVAGASKLVDPAEVRAFIHGETGGTDQSDPSEKGLLLAGKEYSDLKESGDAAAAREWLEKVRAGIIRTLFATPPDPDDPDADLVAGSISMTSSQIRSLSGADDLYVLARGTLNVGKSTLDSGSSTKSTGIYTSGGGAINIYSGGDCNVNESKVMTFLGGDIMIWSDQGDINAGRGSKTSTTGGLITKALVQVSPPVYQTRVTPPAAGSGLRAVTLDPDGLEGPLVEPEPGDISLFAPAGVIDAGEAGIVGGKLTLAALEVLNSHNIVSFSGGSVGIPSGSDASAGLGSLSGSGGLTESNRMIEQVSGAGAARDSVKTATQVMDDFMAKFLDVRVISFDVDVTEEIDKQK